MAEITGRLLATLHTNGTVQMTFAPNMGGGNMSPLLAKNLDCAEEDFVRTFGLTLAKAAALRAELEQRKTADVVTSIDVELAATLCVPRTTGA
jgi:hypothetical protein